MLQECIALKGYLENAVAPEQPAEVKQNAMIRTLLIDDQNFTDQMLTTILEGIQA